jgi:hypothetical protein
MGMQDLIVGILNFEIIFDPRIKDWNFFITISLTKIMLNVPTRFLFLTAEKGAD